MYCAYYNITLLINMCFVCTIVHKENIFRMFLFVNPHKPLKRHQCIQKEPNRMAFIYYSYIRHFSMAGMMQLSVIVQIVHTGRTNGTVQTVQQSH